MGDGNPVDPEDPPVDPEDPPVEEEPIVNVEAREIGIIGSMIEVRVDVQNIEDAVEYRIEFYTSGGEPSQTDNSYLLGEWTTGESLWYHKNEADLQYNILTIFIYDGDGVLLHTFYDVPIPTPSSFAL